MKIIAVISNLWVLVPLLIWTLAWKGVALWKAARRNEKIWFVALLILNTLGILEIIYIFFVAKKKEKEIIPDEEIERLTRKKII